MAPSQGPSAPAPTAPPGSVGGRGYGHTATETENQIFADVSHIPNGKQFAFKYTPCSKSSSSDF